jgi:hypothetical protein
MEGGERRLLMKANDAAVRLVGDCRPTRGCRRFLQLHCVEHALEGSAISPHRQSGKSNLPNSALIETRH